MESTSTFKHLEYEVEIPIRGYHLDGYGHVNNARYLELMEEARWDYLERLEAADFFENKNLAFVVVNVNINYKFPATQGDRLKIKTAPGKKGNASISWNQVGVIRDDKPCFDAEVTFVLIDKTLGKPVKITPEMEHFLLPKTTK